MKCRALIALLLPCLALNAPTYAAEAQQIIEKFQSGNLPITDTETPILLPFAMEWDALAATGENANRRAKPEQYQSLTVPDEGRLKASIEALGRNDEAMKFFTDDKTIEAFNQTYEKAISAGSPVGMIPHDQAMEYWMLSKTITAGPEAIEAYPGDGYASPEWCLPPLIRCTPPKPVPKE